MAYKRVSQSNVATLNKPPHFDYVDEIEMESIKVYNVAAAAGLGNYLSDDDNSYEMLSFSAGDLPVDADFGVRISGNSMNPTIENGAIVWVRSTPILNSGDIGIFVLNEEALCKELKIDNDGINKEVSLISHNSEYSPRIIKEGDTLKTVGMVLLKGK